MKTNAGGNPCHGLRPWLLAGFLLLAWLPVQAGSSKAKPPEKIKTIVLGMVAKSGVYPLNKPATIEAAFKAGGGWKPCRVKGCAPPDFCFLKIRMNQRDYGDSFKITIKVDRDSGKVEVTDPEWQTFPLPDNSLLEMPHVGS